MTEVDTSISTPELDLPRPPSARITPSVPLPLPAVVADGCHDCEPTPGAGATEPPTPDSSATQPPSITADAAADSAPSTDDVVERELPRPSAQMALSEPQPLPTAVAAFRDDCDAPRAVVVTVVAAGYDDCDPTPDAAGTTTPPSIMADTANSAPAPPTDVFERDLPRPSPRMALPGPLQPRAVTAAGRDDRDPPTPVAVAVVAAGCDDRDPAPMVTSSSPGSEVDAVETDEHGGGGRNVSLYHGSSGVKLTTRLSMTERERRSSDGVSNKSRRGGSGGGGGSGGILAENHAGQKGDIVRGTD